MNISDKLKEYRAKEKLSQKKMADLLGTSTGTLGRIERGLAQPSEEMMEKIAALLGPAPKKAAAKKAAPVRDEEAEARRAAEEAARMKARDEQIKREAEEALARVQKETENAAIRGKLELELEKKEGPAVFIQSQTDETRLEDVLHRVWKAEPRAEKIYVKPGENRAYWTYQDQSGWVWLF